MTRWFFYAVAVALVVWIVVTARSLADPGVSDGVPAPPDPAVSSAVPPGRLSQSGPAADLELAALRRRVRVEHARYLRAHRRVRQLTRTLQSRHSTLNALGPVDAIQLLFGPWAGQALTVGRCESGLRTGARNGQYQGIFQMGAGERARYGGGRTALDQTRAAFVYFVLSGMDWSPWECKP